MQIDLRPAQQQILTYRGGWMGISAVPGSGKTFTLSALAATIIQQGLLKEGQQVLVVTLVNSAVDNFSQRVAGFLKEDSLLPGMGYRVRTLHGLANDIIRQRPALAGLPNDFTIIDEHEAEQILTGSISAWMHAHGSEMHDLIDENAVDFNTVSKKNLPYALQEMANAFIRTAKDSQLSPDEITAKLNDFPVPLPLVDMANQVYNDYQRALLYRNSLDFDDLIRNALSMLQQDEQLLLRLREQWPYILEDEAQDSSRLQEDILRLLAGEGGNWVRVGDPNQAIYESFTTANPQYLRNFVQHPKVQAYDLPSSGRSTKGIIHLANQFIDWVMDEHPNPQVRDALAPPYIQSVGKDDPAPNPNDTLTVIQAIEKVYSSDEELERVAASAGKWLQAHPQNTLAILAQQNKHMEGMAEVLKKKGIPYVELLRSTSSSRETAACLTGIIRFLTNPRSSILVAEACKIWLQMRSHGKELNETQQTACDQVRRTDCVEDFFYPLEIDPLDRWERDGADVAVINLLSEFRAQLRTWLGVVLLPVDQLLLTVAQDLFHEPFDLALAHKIASYLVQMGHLHPEWRLPEYANELSTFAGYQRKMIGFSGEDNGFDPLNYKGKVVLATLHKAKGLEWDKVYLTSVNTFDYPSGAAGDEFYSERWFLRGQINLQAETLAELDFLLHSQGKIPPIRGDATIRERKKLIQERLRLFYVGMTRARCELVMTCNNGTMKKAKAAIALTAVKQMLDNNKANPED
jgi:DNA helicase II / ATP-dependent DNA helicase PcrA